jgi:hypothetical protein
MVPPILSIGIGFENVGIPLPISAVNDCPSDDSNLSSFPFGTAVPSLTIVPLYFST